MGRKKIPIDAPVVLITGASSGIGLALAWEYSRRGYNLILAARRVDRLELLSSEIRALTPTCLVQIAPCDVCKEEDLRDAVRDGLARFGRLDVVVANAGFAVSGPFEQLSASDWTRQLDTNFFGVTHTLRAALPALKEFRGRFAIIGSVNSYVSLPGNAPYSVSKFAVRALAESLRHELGIYGVAVTLICPGFVETEIRMVDKQGRFRKEWRDFVPGWLVMKKEMAAAKIATAIDRRKRERIVTAHGWWAVFVARHAPIFFHILFRLTRKKVLSRYLAKH